MITERKVSIYEKYNGFLEAYIFENEDLPNKDFDLMDWSTIDELIGSIILSKKDNVSSDFKIKLESYIQQETENEIVVKHLKKLAQMKIDSVEPPSYQ